MQQESEPIRKVNGVVAVIVRGTTFLVIRRSQFVPAPGQYCFPGGGILAGEDQVTALVRELLEELNVEVLPPATSLEQRYSMGSVLVLVARRVVRNRADRTELARS